MKNILIFSGTTEGRKLAERLSEAHIPATVCVATEYGRQVMPYLPDITLHQGRLNVTEMETLMRENHFTAVVDATHPFAVEVSENIRQSADRTSLPYLRLKRDTKWSSRTEAAYFDNHQACVRALMLTEGNILLTTGSKELAVYCQHPAIKERLYVRVLPSEESIALCRQQGLTGRQILAMQGPFSTEMNAAMIHQYDIRQLVTKESGTTGGFEEKASAAKQTETALYIIGNPEKQEGYSFEAVCEQLEVTAPTLHISLIGTGMGSKETLTAAAAEKISSADYIFGAQRLLTDTLSQCTVQSSVQTYPYYMAGEILPVLEQIPASASAAILFSGDSGFYSGCQKLYQQLQTWKQSRKERITIHIYPGISSVSYFAAACGISWQDADIMSIHGKGERAGWEAELLDAARYHEKLFLLVSGVKDVRLVGSILNEAGLNNCRILLGYQLSYPEESICELTPAQCEAIENEGLYILAILNQACEKRYLAPQKNDAGFVRGKIPMTKEEIRETVICKLKLYEHAVVYDIGSGTGSVAIEMADRSASIQVYALEQKEEGAALIRRNRSKFHVANMTVIEGKAPEALENLPVPTHAFIGGSGGRLKDILSVLYRKNPSMRIVITAISLETVSELTEIFNTIPVIEPEIIQMQVSKAKKAGKYHLMQAENPVYICSFYFNGSHEL